MPGRQIGPYLGRLACFIEICLMPDGQRFEAYMGADEERRWWSWCPATAGRRGHHVFSPIQGGLTAVAVIARIPEREPVEEVASIIHAGGWEEAESGFPVLRAAFKPTCRGALWRPAGQPCQTPR